jgi:hypothetical protein
MGFGERDSTRNGTATAVAVYSPLRELERRVDEALATARASEAAVMTVGAAAFDAAEQARRAAELAERASAAMLAARPGTAMPAERPPPSGADLLPPEPAVGAVMVTAAEHPIAKPEGGGLYAFNLRADRLATRLGALGTRPVSLAV